MKAAYNIRMKDGSLFLDAKGAPYVFHALAEAKSWIMPGESVIPASQQPLSHQVEDHAAKPSESQGQQDHEFDARGHGSDEQEGWAAARIRKASSKAD